MTNINYKPCFVDDVYYDSRRIAQRALHMTQSQFYAAIKHGKIKVREADLRDIDVNIIFNTLQHKADDLITSIEYASKRFRESNNQSDIAEKTNDTKNDVLDIKNKLSQICNQAKKHD